MDQQYEFIADLAEVLEAPEEGKLSRTIYQDEYVKAVLLGLDRGQELPEHTASMPAVIHIIRGEATLTLGGEVFEANAGAWVHMKPNLPHSVKALTPLIMLLLLIKSGVRKPGKTR